MRLRLLLSACAKLAAAFDERYDLLYGARARLAACRVWDRCWYMGVWHPSRWVGKWRASKDQMRIEWRDQAYYSWSSSYDRWSLVWRFQWLSFSLPREGPKQTSSLRDTTRAPMDARCRPVSWGVCYSRGLARVDVARWFRRYKRSLDWSLRASSWVSNIHSISTNSLQTIVISLRII